MPSPQKLKSSLMKFQLTPKKGMGLSINLVLGLPAKQLEEAKQEGGAEPMQVDLASSLRVGGDPMIGTSREDPKTSFPNGPKT